MERPLRHVQYWPSDIRAWRRLAAADRFVLGLELAELTQELSTAGRQRAWLKRRSGSS